MSIEGVLLSDTDWEAIQGEVRERLNEAFWDYLTRPQPLPDDVTAVLVHPEVDLEEVKKHIRRSRE